MSLEKTLKKILSVTLVVAFMLQQTGFVFAATPESNWLSLKTDVEATAGEYNVTTALTAAAAPWGTINITAGGNTITGASLTENSTQDALFYVGSGVASFTLGNNVSGSIINNGTMTYTGSSLADGTVTGSGTFVFGGTTTNANAITQTTVRTTSSANVTNNAAVTATTFTNKGTFDNNAMITASISNESGATLLTDPAKLGGAVANEGIVKLDANGNLTQNITGTAGRTEIRANVNNQATISQDTIKVGTGYALTSNADNLVATAGIFNDGTLNLTAGANANAINGDGNVVFSNTVVNNGAIAQTSVSNSGALTNNAAVTAKLANTGTVVGSGSIKLTNDSSSTGDITQDDFDTNGFDFSNTAALTTNASFVNAATFSGVGGTLTLAAGTANNSGTITQDAVNNAVDFTNTGIVNTDSLQNLGLFLGNGIINLTGDSTNAGTITQDLVTLDNNMTFSNNGMLLAQVTNASGSTLNSDPDNLGKNVFNSGTVNLNDSGTLSVLIDGTGDTNINGDLTNNGKISQDNINIGAGNVVTSSASDMTATTAINNDGIISYTSGTTANTITGSGRVDINGYVTNNGDITQTTVGNNGVFTNNGTVTANLDNTKTIEGTGSITTGTGISSNTGTIAQASLTNNGTFDNAGHITLTGALTNNDTFNTNADLLAAAGGVSNAGDLNITGGTNANAITGAGTTKFTGDATNDAAITQTTVTNSANLTNNALITANVTNSGTLTSDGANIAGNIANTGSYVITNGDNANAITGTGTTTIFGNTTNNGSITQEKVIVGNGANFITASDTVTAAIENQGTMLWNGGTSNSNVVTGNGGLVVTGTDILNTASISQDTITVANGSSLIGDASLLTTANGITNNGDLNFTNGTNTNQIIGVGDLTVSGVVDNQATISQTNIVVGTVGQLTTNADLLTADITNNGDLAFTGGTNANNIIGTGTTVIDGTVTNAGDISTDILVSATGNLGTLTDIVSNVENRNIVQIIDADITSTGKIKGSGITNILGDTTNYGSIDSSAVNIAAGASLTTDSSKVTGAIANEGDLIWNAGATNNNVVSGKGDLTITGTDILNTASISQESITVNGSGSLTSDAGLLTSANGIINYGDLAFLSGTNTNEIFGTGDLDILGNVTNQAAIEQDTITVSLGQLTSDAGLLVATSGITNDAALSLTGGTNTNVITGTGTTFIDGTVENTGTIDTNIGVGTSGHYATTSDITKDLINNGITDITNADINADITGTGTTNILGLTTNNGGITQGTLNIASSGYLDTDIDNVNAAITNEGFLEINNGTSNANTITGTGSLAITGGDIANTATISQDSIAIISGALSTDASLLTSASGITNNDGLTFTGGINANAITGTGDLTTTGNVTNNAAISQNTITVSGGKLTTAADALTTANGITNNSEISFVSGDNLNDITGSGVTYIDGTVQNLADIYTDMTVNTGAHYGTATDVHAKIDNRGTTDLIDADILAGGKISGTGTTNILGDTVNNGSITQSALTIAAGGSLTTNSQDVNAAVTNEGDLIWNAGGANTNVISGSGELEITGGNIANSASISQGTITINGGSLTSDADLLATVGGIENNADLALTGGTNTNVITGTGDLATSGEVLNKSAITQNSLTNTGDFANDGATIVADIVNSGNFLNNDGTITGDITNSGVFATNGDDVTGDITNNGTYIIEDGDNSNDITGTGDVQIEGTTINMGTIGQDNIFVATGAEFVVADISDITTTTGIDNAGTLELQSGANANVITGNTGALNITGVVTNNSGVSINQDTINVATLGDFTADAGDLVTVDGITNTGKLTLGDGATANNISGTGTLTTNGTITNTGNIDQKSLTNTGVLTSNADLLAFADGIDNSNILNLTGGTNANVITGTGTTSLTNDVINNAEITQAKVENATGTLTNNAAITADFDNNGGTVNNEAVITGKINNVGGTINSTADNLNGAVTTSGASVLNIAGGTTQNTITGAGDMNITDDLVNAYDITQTNVVNSANLTNNAAITADVTNSGVIDNDATLGTITGSITNSGTINSVATNLVGAIANSGTLNLDGGTTQDVITGTGETNITADLVNAYAITQTTVTNTASLTNNATITATDIVNSGTITGKASDLVASNEIANDGTLVFNAASTGASDISGTGEVQVTADTTLTGTNTYAGGTLIDAVTLTVAGASNIGTGDVTFANNGILDVTAAGSLDHNLVGQTPASDDVTVQNAAALILNGNIGDAKDFHKAGAGDMTLAMASNSYTGDTYVDGGKLIGNTGNINNIVYGAAGTTVEFNDTTDADLNGINTLGAFVQSGSAKLDVKNNAFSANTVDVNAGIFAANRALTATTMNINTGAKLQGNGNIIGDVYVNSGATLAPGNSIDTLTITGNLNLASGSTTAIEITDTPASDKVVVTGNTNIAGGANLTVSNVSGRYFEWESFDIVEAANVAGTFTYDGEVSDYDTGRINVSVDYSDPTKVTLTAKRKATDYSGTGAGVLSRNENEVAMAVDHVSTGFGGDITETLLQLEELGGLTPTGVTLINPNATFQSALNDLAGSLYANSAMLPLFNAKTAHVYDRIAKRNPSTGECPTCHDNVWVEYYNQYDKVYANQNSPRYNNTMTGVMAGYDRSSDEVLLGVYGGYGESNLRQLNSKMDIEDGTLGIYSGYMNGNWLVKGSLFTGRQNYYGKRYISFMDRTATARYEGWNAGLDVEGSYNLAVFDWMNVKPFVGVFGNYAHQQAFTEKDAGAISLHVESHDQVTVQGRLGFQLDGKVKNRLSWYGSVAVRQIFGNDYAKLHMSFELPGTRMDIVGAELGRTYLSGQFGLNYAITDSLSLYGNLDTGVNDKSANCYGNIGVAFTW